MNFKTILFSSVIITGVISAHDRILEKAELATIIELQAKIDACHKAVQAKETVIVHKDKIIAAKDNYILFLEKTLHHYKHELHKEKDHIAYLEILRALGF